MQEIGTRQKKLVKFNKGKQRERERVGRGELCSTSPVDEQRRARQMMRFARANRIGSHMREIIQHTHTPMHTHILKHGNLKPSPPPATLRSWQSKEKNRIPRVENFLICKFCDNQFYRVVVVPLFLSALQAGRGDRGEGAEMKNDVVGEGRGGGYVSLSLKHANE